MGVVTEQFATDKQFHSSGPPAKEPSHVPSQAFSSQRGARRGELYSFRGGKVGRRYSSGYGAGCRRECFFFRGRRERRGCGHGHNRSPQSLPTAVPWTREPPRRERGTGGRSAFLLKGSGRDSKRMDGETLRGVFFLLASPAFFFSTVSKEKERERGVFFSCLLACFCFCFVLLSFPRETLGHSFFFFSR